MNNRKFCFYTFYTIFIIILWWISDFNYWGTFGFTTSGKEKLKQILGPTITYYCENQSIPPWNLYTGQCLHTVFSILISTFVCIFATIVVCVVVGF